MYYANEPFFDKLVDEFNLFYKDEFIIYVTRLYAGFTAYCLSVEKISEFTVSKLISSKNVEFIVRGQKPHTFLRKLEEKINGFKGREDKSVSGHQVKRIFQSRINGSW